jgi:hypothetical protein
VTNQDPVIADIKLRAANLVPLLVDLSRYKKDGGSHVRGPCPWKATSDSDAFRIDLKTGGWAYFVEAQGEENGTGDVISLVQRIRDLDFPAAKLWAAAQLGIKVESKGHQPSFTTPQASAIAPPSPEPDGPAPIDLQGWFKEQYGIDVTPEQLEIWGIKRVQHVFNKLKPHKVETLEYRIRLKGGGQTVRYRSIQRFGGKRLPAGAYKSGFQNGAFDPAGSLDKCAGDRLFIVGGEEKCLALVLDGLLAISTACGEKPTFHDDFLELLRENPPDEIIVVYDVYAPDEAGRLYSARAAKYITAKTGIPARFVRWPEDLRVGHDINDISKSKGLAAVRPTIMELATAPTPDHLPPEHTPVEKQQPDKQKTPAKKKTLADYPELGKLWTAEELLATSFPEPRWIVKDFIPEVGLAMFAGDPKSGKSFMALQLALAVNHGGFFLVRPGDAMRTGRSPLLGAGRSRAPPSTANCSDDREDRLRRWAQRPVSAIRFSNISE